MPKFLDEHEIKRLENWILTNSDQNPKISNKYEDYKECVEMITPLIDELRKYCFKGCVEI